MSIESRESSKVHLIKINKLMIMFWFSNLSWLFLMLWGVEFCIQEKGMVWMKDPQEYSLWFCSLTKIILTVSIMINIEYIKNY